MSEINKILLERNAKEAKETESQYQNEGTITFDVYDDDDFARLLISFLREKLVQDKELQRMILLHGNDVCNFDLAYINILIEKMKIANPSLSKKVITSFYGKHCKKCGYNIKVYCGKKENPCHRCGEVN